MTSSAGRQRDGRQCGAPPIRGEPYCLWHMDVHEGMFGITPEALRDAHQADLDIQDSESVDFQHAWADPESGRVWCISEAPSADAVRRIHERAGHPAAEVFPVPVEA